MLTAAERERELAAALVDVCVGVAAASRDGADALDITTHEGDRFRLVLTDAGWQLIPRATASTSGAATRNSDGVHVDVVATRNATIFETVHAALDAVSPRFRARFASALAQALASLVHVAANDDKDDEDEVA